MITKYHQGWPKTLLHLMHTSRLWSLFLSCEKRTDILRGEITLCIIQWLDVILEENSLPVSEEVYLLICNARCHQNRIKGTCWSNYCSESETPSQKEIYRKQYYSRKHFSAFQENNFCVLIFPSSLLIKFGIFLCFKQERMQSQF